MGIVGLAAFNVTTRTKQLGTRRAIGARKFHIVRYFLVENWLITTGGVVLGCILALAAGVQLSRMYQIPQLPLYYLVGGVLLLWIVGLLAVLILGAPRRLHFAGPWRTPHPYEAWWSAHERPRQYLSVSLRLPDFTIK